MVSYFTQYFYFLKFHLLKLFVGDCNCDFSLENFQRGVFFASFDHPIISPQKNMDFISEIYDELYDGYNFLSQISDEN